MIVTQEKLTLLLALERDPMDFVARWALADLLEEDGRPEAAALARDVGECCRLGEVPGERLSERGWRVWRAIRESWWVWPNPVCPMGAARVTCDVAPPAHQDEYRLHHLTSDAPGWTVPTPGVPIRPRPGVAVGQRWVYRIVGRTAYRWVTLWVHPADVGLLIRGE